MPDEHPEHFQGDARVQRLPDPFPDGPGDIIAARPGEWHWHGATPDSSMTHVTVQPGGTIDWDVEEGDWAEGYG